MGRNGRPIFAASLLGMALAIALAACDSPPPPQPGPRPVRVATVQLTPADEMARYAAVIQPRVEADLGFRVGGKVAERLVQVGDRVEPGMPLARLDPTDLDLQVRAAEAQLAAARADQRNAQGEFDRYASLRQGEWTTRQEFERRATALDRAKARVKEIEAHLDLLRNNARYTTLVADAPGVVTAVLVEPGLVVAQGRPAVRIARLGELEAVADVPEHEAGAFTTRQLSVEAWALPGATIAGRLREMAPSADPVTRTYRARVTLADPPAGIQIGMTATVVARQPRPGTVARVPLSAITQKGGAPAVWVVNDAGDRVALRPVQVAAFAGDLAIVADGLAEGERIVTAGVHKLDAGQPIRVWTEPVR